MSKHKSRPDGLAYSTNQAFFNDYQEENMEQETIPAKQQKLRIKLDSKQRAGKIVTLVKGFIGTTADLETLGKQLKTKCGTGGSVKNGHIIIQGDYKEKLIVWLKGMGYGDVK